jgi:hypothetical protein
LAAVLCTAEEKPWAEIWTSACPWKQEFSLVGSFSMVGNLIEARIVNNSPSATALHLACDRPWRYDMFHTLR